MASYEIGQYFKKEGKEGSFEHIATHAVIGALTASANGGNAFAGAVSAGGAEYIAQKTAETLFQKDADKLTADEKEMVSSIAQLVGTLSGSLKGDSAANAYIGGTVATNAVENNSLHIAKNGVVAKNIIDDGDKNIYQYDFICNTQEECRNIDLEPYISSRQVVGQLMFLDSFTSPDTGLAGGKIYLGEDITPYIYQLNYEAKNKYGWNVARKSFPGGEYDVKSNYPRHEKQSFHGFLFNGKYISLRDAGNILAGMNAASLGVPFDDFQRVSGALHTNGEIGAINAYFRGKAYAPPPMYGELPYQYYKSRYGYDLGIQKIVERNEQASREKSLIPANMPSIGDAFNGVHR